MLPNVNDQVNLATNSKADIDEQKSPIKKKQDHIEEIKKRIEHKRKRR